MSPPGLCTSLQALGDASVLAAEWRSLEQVCQSGFFRSWGWIGPLLASLPPDLEPRVLRVFDTSGQVVGLGLWWPRSERRHGVVHSRVWHLNETGMQEFDRLTIEHNGLLALPGRQAEIVAAALAQLRAAGAWDELSLGGIPSKDFDLWRHASAYQGLGCRVRWQKPYFFVDLDSIRASGKDYLDVLSSNTRYQVRRAMRLCERNGDLACDIAETPALALEWFLEMVELHQAQWRARGHDGAFGSEFTLRFHSRLLSEAAPAHVWMTRLRAGNSVLGYLYNFQRDGIVYNYQSGHVADQDAKMKTGLVCHALAITEALLRGCHGYDLMMGGGHFKASLTNAQGTMTWATLQRPRLVFRLENWLRAEATRRRAQRAASPETAASSTESPAP